MSACLFDRCHIPRADRDMNVTVSCKVDSGLWSVTQAEWLYLECEHHRPAWPARKVEVTEHPTWQRTVWSAEEGVDWGLPIDSLIANF